MILALDQWIVSTGIVFFSIIIVNCEGKGTKLQMIAVDGSGWGLGKGSEGGGGGIGEVKIFICALSSADSYSHLYHK